MAGVCRGNSWMMRLVSRIKKRRDALRYIYSRSSGNRYPRESIARLYFLTHPLFLSLSLLSLYCYLLTVRSERNPYTIFHLKRTDSPTYLKKIKNYN